MKKTSFQGGNMKILGVLCCLLFAFAALAQGEVIVAPTGDELVKLLQSLGGIKGAQTLAIVALCVQAVLLFFRSSFAKFSGIYQLIIVNALTMAAGVIALSLQGMPLSAAIFHSQTIAAFQVLAHQVMKQIANKPKEIKI
jgi:hypothetical protein